MEQEIIIGVAVAIALAVIIGVHSWLNKLVNFKMDESAILKFFGDADGDYKFQSTEAISANTNISIERVSIVCSKSKAIKRNAKEKEFWCLQ